MTIKDLLPSIWKRDDNPVYSLQKEMNTIFDDFFKRFALIPFEREPQRFGSFSPSIDVRDNGKDVTIKAELPGIDEKDIEVSMIDGAITIKGEKKEEKEDKGKNYYRMERSYGSFSRTIPMPTGIDSQKADAVFKKGVLTITVPKTEDAKTKLKKIRVKTD